MSGSTSRRCIANARPRSPACSTRSSRPASTSSATASSPASASRCTCRSAWRASAARPAAPRRATSRNSRYSRERLRQQRGRRNRIANPPKAIGAVRYTACPPPKPRTICSNSRSAAWRQARRDVHVLGVARHHRHHHGQRALRLLRDLCVRARRRTPQGIRADRDDGYLLQLDAPDFGLERARMFKDQTDAEFLRAMELNIEAINRATKGIPRDASACTSAGATGRGRTPTTSRSRGCSPSFTAPRSARSASSSPIHATSMNTRRCETTRCRRK